MIASGRKPAVRFFGILLVAAGVFFLGAVLRNPGRLVAWGARTQGEVVEVTEKSSSSATSRREGESRQAYRERRQRKSTRYFLRVRFTAADGVPAEFTTTSTFGHVLKTGDAVGVVYLPGDPSEAEIDSSRQLWLPLATGTLLGSACLAGGVLLLRPRR